MPSIQSISFERKETLEIEIKNHVSYFTLGRRAIWINEATYRNETNVELILRALSLITIVNLLLKWSALSHAKAELKELSLRLPSFIKQIPDDLLLMMMEFITFEDSLKLQRTSKRFAEIYQNTPQLQRRYQLAKSLSSPPPSLLNIDRIKMSLGYNPAKKEIFIATAQLTPSLKDMFNLSLFDLSLKEKSDMTSIKLISNFLNLNKQARAVTTKLTVSPLSNGDFITYFKSPNQEWLTFNYFDRQNHILYSKNFHHPTEEFHLVRTYCHENSPHMITASKSEHSTILSLVKLQTSNQEITDELLCSPELRWFVPYKDQPSTYHLVNFTLVDRLEIGCKKDVRWIGSTQDNTHFWMIAKGDNHTSSLLEYDCKNLKLDEFANPFNLSHETYFDESLNAVIGIGKSNEIVIFNTYTKTNSLFDLGVSESDYKIGKFCYDSVKRWVICCLESPTLPGKMIIFDLFNKTFSEPSLEYPTVHPLGMSNLTGVDTPRFRGTQDLQYDAKNEILMLRWMNQIYAWDFLSKRLIQSPALMLKHPLKSDCLIWDQENGTLVTCNSKESRFQVEARALNKHDGSFSGR